MNHSDKYIPRKGNFVLDSTDGSFSSLAAGIVGANANGQPATFFGFEVREDNTTITSVFDNGQDVTDNGDETIGLGLNLSGKTLYRGDMFFCSTEVGFTDITVASGSVTIFRQLDVIN